jgi:hypothetical protein
LERRLTKKKNDSKEWVVTPKRTKLQILYHLEHRLNF